MSTALFSPRAARVAFLSLTLAACGGKGATDPKIERPLTGRFSGALGAGETETISFQAGRTGPANASVCAAVGTTITLTVAGKSAANATNCARVEFDARAGTVYDIVVRIAEGPPAPFSGCWATAFLACGVTAPAPTFVPPANLPDTGYYRTARGLAGTALREALGNILRNGHRFLDYTQARDSMYAFIDDENDDDIIVDIYVGRAATVNSRASAFAADFNAEHRWPQSLGANTSTRAGTDIHILVTSDENANQARLNYPFGEVTGTVQWVSPDVAGVTDSSVLGADAQGRTVFEPRDSKKGDVARAILYWYLRYYYDRPPGFSLINFNVEEQTLLDWHFADPPDAAERERNRRVFRAQGNRNPLIDFPEIARSLGDLPNS